MLGVERQACFLERRRDALIGGAQPADGGEQAERAAARGEAFPSLDAVLDDVLAPILFRILFDEALGPARVGELVERVFEGDRRVDDP